jgi:DMSO reductase family type II enzyme chaperone
VTVAAVREDQPGVEEDEPARGRAGLYGLLSRAFSFPEASLHAEILDGRWPAELTSALAGLPYRLRAASASWKAPEDYDLFQSEYIRLFEVGDRGGAPCPLYSGQYARDRLRVMEELIRFYNFFGLRIVPGMMPDHVTVELEFMQYLSLRDQEAGDGESCARAERDFLERHILSWWGQLAAKLNRERPLPFYRSAVRLAGAFFAAEARHLSRLQQEWGDQ